jgi:y4mF family transcriptional regulator
MNIQRFVKEKRKATGLTQPDLAERAGVGLRFVRDLEQGKATLRMDKVNLVLRTFGHELGPVPMDRDLLLDSETGIGRSKKRSMQ